MIRSPGIVVLFSALAAVSCGDGGTPGGIAEAREFEPTPPRDFRVRSHVDRFGRPTMPPATTADDGAVTSGLRWDTPAGWRELPATSMRVANFAIGDDGATECYLSPLRGGGGMVAGNLDRWRGQLGLPALTADEVAALPRGTLLGIEGPVLFAEGTYAGMGGQAREGYALLGLIVDVGGDAISVKMVGPAAAVRSERDAFLAFCAGVRRDGEPSPSTAATPAEVAPPEAAIAEGLALTWAVPAGWVQREGASPMRTVTLFAGGNTDAECAVFVFPGAAGGELANVSRWYEQMGQEMPPGGLDELEEVLVLGRLAHLVDAVGSYQGMGGESRDDYAMLAVYSGLEDHAVCVKLTGPREVVDAERERFLDFCESLRTSQ